MKIDYFLGDGDKLSALKELRQEIYKQMYRYCLLANIDPDSFDYKNFLLEHKNNLNSMIIRYYPDLVNYCEKLDIIEKKIEEIHVN